MLTKNTIVYIRNNQIVAEIRRSYDISPNETSSLFFCGFILFFYDYKTTKIGNNRQLEKTMLKKSSIVMFANFHGLNVKLVSELRKLLRQADSKYFVTRKTLVKKALEASSFGMRCPTWKARRR